MKTFDAIRSRRSVKRFSSAPITRDEVEAILELAVHAPNHRLTEPWGFIVMGPGARRRLGEIKGARRAAKVPERAAAEEIYRRTVEQAEEVPLMIAFTQRLTDDDEVREEDFASVYMAIQNVLLGATAVGFGTHVRTGAILNATETRDALGVAPEERVVAIVDFGRIDGEGESTPAKPRTPARERTRWVD